MLLFLYISPVYKLFKSEHICLKIFSFLTALGICLTEKDMFCAEFKSAFSDKFNPLIFDAISFILLVFSLLSVYLFVLFIYSRLRKTVIESGLFNDLKKYELILYSLIFVFSVVFITLLFLKTNAFYGTNYGVDIIYTSDSSSLVKNNVYLNLMYIENDIRQPLFAIFSSPFIGFFALINILFNTVAPVRAIVLNIPQLCLLLISNYMLAKMLKLTPQKRIVFMIFVYSSYTTMLFSMMMEQYIIAHFWLILCIYQLHYKNSIEFFSLYGAVGTLLTSAVLIPFTEKEKTNLEEYLVKTVTYGFIFVVLMLLCCRIDIFINLVKRLDTLARFSGVSISLQEKIFQYSNFLASCFFTPKAGINTIVAEGISWQLLKTENINILGCFVFAACLLSLLLNRKKKIIRISGLWMFFSVIILVVIGWGTQENGLILYSLYFGWPCFVMIFELIQYIESKFNLKRFAVGFILITSIIMLAINVCGMIDLINFSVKYYPV